MPVRQQYVSPEFVIGSSKLGVYVYRSYDGNLESEVTDYYGLVAPNNIEWSIETECKCAEFDVRDVPGYREGTILQNRELIFAAIESGVLGLGGIKGVDVE